MSLGSRAGGNSGGCASQVLAAAADASSTRTALRVRAVARLRNGGASVRLHASARVQIRAGGLRFLRGRVGRSTDGAATWIGIGQGAACAFDGQTRYGGTGDGIAYPSIARHAGWAPTGRRNEQVSSLALDSSARRLDAGRIRRAVLTRASVWCRADGTATRIGIRHIATRTSGADTRGRKAGGSARTRYAARCEATRVRAAPPA